MRVYVTTWLLALLIWQCHAESKQLSEIDKMRYELLKLEQKLWNTDVDEQTNSISSKQSSEVDLIRSYQKFGDELELLMPKDITDGVQPLQNLWVWARMYGEMRPIYTLYEAFRRFQKMQTDSGRIPSPRQAWENHAEDIENVVPEALKKMSDLIKNEKLFQEALKELVFEPCEVHLSANQVLYNLHNSVALTELKGYIMLQWSWQLLKLLNKKGNFSEKAQSMRQIYQERATATTNAAKAAMTQTSGTKQLWRCDPKTHIKGETYTELTQLLQAYIENEIDLSPSKSCFKNCAYYDYAKSQGCYKNGYCSKQTKCLGKVLNCKYIDSDMWICPADIGSGRRYEYIEYENGQVLGRKMGCRKGRSKVDSWWRYLFWHCSYCICLCDDDGPYSDRYFNLREAVSDIENNKVVTGLKFVKVNKIIQLQIQEGELRPYGKIDNTTLRWKPVDNYKLTDKNVVEGTDYTMMSWERRDIDLDDLQLTDNYVVTGVRFRMLGTHLNLEIRASPFNFTSGQLIQANIKSFWHSSDNTLDRKRLYLRNPDVPTRTYLPSMPDSQNDQFLEFTNTDFERDAGQTTVPFIDIQNVVSEIPTPLSGAGIYHKGQPNFGGFVAPKIITYDFSQHLQVVFPTEFDIKDGVEEDSLKEVSVN